MLGASILAPDPGLIIWTTIVFLILWFMLGKYAFKPIARALKSREDSIEEALRSADEAKIEMENLKADNEKLLNKAREERSKILAEAKEVKNKILSEAKDQAKIEASKIAESNRREIENQKNAAIADIQRAAGELALDIAEKVVRKEMDKSGEQESYIKKLLSDIKLN